MAVRDEMSIDLADPGNLIFVQVAPEIAFLYCTCHLAGSEEAIHSSRALCAVIFVVFELVALGHPVQPSNSVTGMETVWVQVPPLLTVK